MQQMGKENDIRGYSIFFMVIPGYYFYRKNNFLTTFLSFHIIRSKNVAIFRNT